MPDPYFQSGSYSVFLTWIDTIRKHLLALNPYQESNRGDVVLKEQHKNITDTKKITNEAKIVSNAEMVASIEVFRKLQQKNQEDAAKIASYNQIIESQTVSDNTAKTSDVKSKYVKIALENTKDMIDDYNKETVNKTVTDFGEEGNPNPNSLRDEAQPISDFTNPTVIQNNGQYSSTGRNIFPQTGADVTSSITKSLIDSGRFEYNFFMNGKKTSEYRGWVKFPGRSNLSITNDEAIDNLQIKAVADTTKFYGTPSSPLTKYSEAIINNSKIISPTGTYKFFIEKLHGRYYSNGAAMPYKMNPIDENQQKIYDSKGKNFFNRQVFAAFIDNYSDDYHLNWTSYNFLGRGEKAYAYSNTDRNITLSFTILTDHALDQMAALDKINEQLKSSSQEDILSFLLNNDTVHWGAGTYLNDYKQRSIGGTSTYYDTPETTWQKLTFLAQCCYPYYRTDGKMKEQPMVRLRIADFYDVICMFTSLNVQLNPFDMPLIDFNSSTLGEQPMGFKVTIAATIIHDYEPSSQFYGFYHRKQFDSNDAEANYKAKVWGVGLTKNADTLRNALTKKSPLGIKNVLNTKNLQDLLSTTDFLEIQNDIQILKENFNGLENKTVNLFEEVRRIKLKNIFDAIKSIQSKTDFFNALSEISNELAPALTTAVDIYGTAKMTQEIVNNNASNIERDLKNFTPSDITASIVQGVTARLKSTEPKTIGDIINGTAPVEPITILATNQNSGTNNPNNNNQA